MQLVKDGFFVVYKLVDSLLQPNYSKFVDKVTLVYSSTLILGDTNSFPNEGNLGHSNDECVV